MNSFTFCCPTKVVFGTDTVKLTGSEVKAFGAAKVLVVYGGGSVVKNGVLDNVTRSLSAEKLDYSCVGGAQPNPLAEFAQQIVDDYKQKGIDFVLGVGGGSAIDTAKAVAIGLASPDIPIWDIFCGKSDVSAALPVGTVVTIAAAGSETSNSCVLTSQTAGMKRGIRSPYNVPALAIMDPTVTYSLPEHQTACGVTDIMMHTLDRYFAPDADNALTDALAEALLRTVIKNGRDVLKNPHDYKARSELMWASSLSHNGLMGLGQTMDFAVHQLGHALSAKYDIPHGESLSAVWQAWANYTCHLDIPRFAGYARNVWNVTEEDNEAAAKAGIAATVEYFRFLGMPVTISEAVGATDNSDIDQLTDLCTYHNTRTIGSFMVLDAGKIRDIYRSATEACTQ